MGRHAYLQTLSYQQIHLQRNLQPNNQTHNPTGTIPLSLADHFPIVTHIYFPVHRLGHGTSKPQTRTSCGMKFAHSWKMSRRTQKNGGWKSWKWLGGDQDGRPQKQNDSHYTRATEKPGERERNDCREVKLSTNPNKTTGWKGFHPKPSVIRRQQNKNPSSQALKSKNQHSTWKSMITREKASYHMKCSSSTTWRSWSEVKLRIAQTCLWRQTTIL